MHTTVLLACLSKMISPPTSLSRSVVMLGDVMLGRLIDTAALPHPTNDYFEDVRSMTELGHSLRQSLGIAGHSPQELFARLYGDCIPLLSMGGFTLINLECCITANNDKFTPKKFNYRMNPLNLGALQQFPITFACASNNHVLDYKEPGLLSTLEALASAGIRHAGAGHNLVEASKEVLIQHPALGLVQVASFADHGCCLNHPKTGRDLWAASDKPGIHFLDVEAMSKSKKILFADTLRMKKVLNKADLSIVSCHWGPNWCWSVDSARREMARVLVETGEVDIVHGHSSHHVQGVEFIKGKPVIYGCGPFVDDYAVDPEYRNDLGLVWQYEPPAPPPAAPPSSQPAQSAPNPSPNPPSSQPAQSAPATPAVTGWPIRIRNFCVGRITDPADPDFVWLRDTLTEVCAPLGSLVTAEEGGAGGAVLRVVPASVQHGVTGLA